MGYTFLCIFLFSGFDGLWMKRILAFWLKYKVIWQWVILKEVCIFENVATDTHMVCTMAGMALSVLT